MENLGAGGVGAGAVVILGLIYKLLVHFRCKSNCCGHQASVDVNLDTPPTNGGALSLNLKK